MYESGQIVWVARNREAPKAFVYIEDYCGGGFHRLKI